MNEYQNAHGEQKKVASGLKEDQPTMPALRKHSTTMPGKNLPRHRENTSTMKNKNTSKMKKLRNDSHLNQQRSCLKQTTRNRTLQSDRLGVQKGDSENTEGIKRRYE